MMPTTYRIFRLDAEEVEVKSVDWPEEPGYDRIKALIEPLIDGEPLEHVAVLHEGERRDMFVSELGALALTTRGPLPVNDAATRIYRNNWLTHHPNTDPESMPAIHGTAILFDRIVWM